MEIWKDILGFEGSYQVSNLGRVRSLDRVIECRNGKIKKLKGRVCAPRPNEKGYLRVCFPDRKDYYVHRLVAAAFLQKQSGFYEVNHLDENKANNSASNLEWTDRLGNVRHTIRSGGYNRARKIQSLAIRGERHPRAKINEKSVLEIRRRHSLGESVTKLSKEFGLTVSGMEKIAYGKAWTHIKPQ